MRSNQHHQQKSVAFKKHGKNSLEIINQTRSQKQSYDIQRKSNKKIQQLLKFDQYMKEFSSTEEYISADDILQIILSLSSTFICSLNHHQMITLAFTIFIYSSCASKISVNTKNSKEQIYHQVCTDKSKSSYNKPNISVGFFASDIYPKSCLTKKDEICLMEFNELKQFNHNPEHLKVRQTSEQLALKWKAGQNYHFTTIVNSLNTNKQKKLFADYFSSICILKLYYYAAETANKWSGGFCNEHASLSLMKLLQLKLQYRLNMKIQTISVSNYQSQSRYLRDHIYLLLDSNIEDVEIINDKILVKKTFDKITTGKICDSWNKGYYVNFTQDDSGLYDDNAQWNTLRIETFNLKFAHFDELTVTAQRFICKILDEMNLGIESGFNCQIFHSRTKSESDKPQQQTKFKSSL